MYMLLFNLQKNDKNVKVEDNDFKKIPQWNVDDVKVMIHLQQIFEFSIHGTCCQ